jgi:hypothetical protein
MAPDSERGVTALVRASQSMEADAFSAKNDQKAPLTVCAASLIQARCEITTAALRGFGRAAPQRRCSRVGDLR